QLGTREERREVGLLVIVGTGIPFILGLVLGPWLIGPALAGPSGNRISLIIILAVGVAVTSIPVISKIFFDLKILHTRFARLVLGVAVIEDILLWAVLAVATALAKAGVMPKQQIALHVGITLVYFAAGLTLVPRLLRRISSTRWNVLATASPVGYLVAVLFAYTALAAVLDVNLVFAAFLSGFAIADERERFAEPLRSL